MRFASEAWPRPASPSLEAPRLQALETRDLFHQQNRKGKIVMTKTSRYKGLVLGSFLAPEIDMFFGDGVGASLVAGRRDNIWEVLWFGCVFASISGEVETSECFHDCFVCTSRMEWTFLPTLARYVVFDLFELERIWFCTSVLETTARRPMCTFRRYRKMLTSERRQLEVWPFFLHVWVGKPNPNKVFFTTHGYVFGVLFESEPKGVQKN